MALPVVLTVSVMPFNYSIANGIGVGFIGWVVLRSAAGKAREIGSLRVAPLFCPELDRVAHRLVR